MPLVTTLNQVSSHSGIGVRLIALLGVGPLEFGERYLSDAGYALLAGFFFGDPRIHEHCTLVPLLAK